MLGTGMILGTDEMLELRDGGSGSDGRVQQPAGRPAYDVKCRRFHACRRASPVVTPPTPTASTEHDVPLDGLLRRDASGRCGDVRRVRVGASADNRSRRDRFLEEG
jgi:hypothetical protein